MSGWRVREACANDAERLALIGAATFLETFAGFLDGAAIVAHCQQEHSPAAYERYLRDGATAFLAETIVGNSPIGFALTGSSSLPGTNQDGSDAELKRIYVLSRFHGDRVGAELLKQVLQSARDRQAKRLLLGVYADNSRAITFYRKHNFVPIADRRFRVGDREYDDVVFAKSLGLAASL